MAEGTRMIFFHFGQLCLLGAAQQGPFSAVWLGCDRGRPLKAAQLAASDVNTLLERGAGLSRLPVRRRRPRRCRQRRLLRRVLEGRRWHWRSRSGRDERCSPTTAMLRVRSGRLA